MHISSRAAGFTVIELLIAMVVIGLLAAITIPKFSDFKGRAYVTTQRSDLANLAMQQESYYSTYRTYAVSVEQAGISPSNGVTVSLANVTVGGWSATTTHVGTVTRCGVFYGSAPPVAPAVRVGVIECQ